jgi:hypothetical protein
MKRTKITLTRSKSAAREYVLRVNGKIICSYGESVLAQARREARAIYDRYQHATLIIKP